MGMNRDAIVALIREAFRGVQLGEGLSIGEADIIDRYAQDEDMHHARSLEIVDAWESIPEELLEERAVLAYMDAEGFRYCIPAYMIWALLNWEKNAAVTIRGTAYALLDPPDRNGLVNLLTDEQKEAIVQFLRYCADERVGINVHPNLVDKALAKYWSKGGMANSWKSASDEVADSAQAFADISEAPKFVNSSEALRSQGDLEGAKPLLERAFELRLRVLGEEHPDTLSSMSSLAEMLRAQGNLEGARDLHEKALDVRSRVLGDQHPDTRESVVNLAATLQALWARGSS